MTILWNNGENDGLTLELGGELIFKVYIFKAGLGSQQYHGWTFSFVSRFFGGGGARMSYVQPEMYYCVFDNTGSGVIWLQVSSIVGLMCFCS